MPESIKEAHDAGLKVIVWTVNNKYRWQKLIDLGVFGICTDLPEELQDYYKGIQ